MEENKMPIADEMLDEVAGGAGKNYKYYTAYKVIKGDNLTKIAREFGVTPDEIQQWNKEKIKNKNHIEVGWVLIIYTNIPQ